MSLNFPIKLHTPPTTFHDKNLKGQYCLSPFIMIDVALNGDIRLCGCADWMPTVVGNVFDTPLDQILSSPLAIEIRQSIINGTYRYCNENTCGILRNNGLNTVDMLPTNVAHLIEDSTRYCMPYEISISGDLTCNLSCPSCRNTIVKVPKDRLEQQEELGEILAKNLFSVPTDQTIHFILSTSGELFASPMLLKFVNKINLDLFPNVVLSIQTNGLLCKSRWDRLGHMEQAVKKVTMTIDAACAETYKIVRRGGTWPEALEALDFLKNKKSTTGMQFHTRMVVQQLNYKEMAKFYELSILNGADVVEYVGLQNWGTYTSDEYQHHNVFNPVHPEYLTAKELLEEIKKLPNTWFAGNF
jgi:MoaA/NifB/PqqE/SkfB family radical SAM enzyme